MKGLCTNPSAFAADHISFIMTTHSYGGDSNSIELPRVMMAPFTAWRAVTVPLLLRLL